MHSRDFSLSSAAALIRSESITGPLADQRDAAPRPPYCITISREAGALGSSVAAEVGRWLSWPVYDRDLLEKVATGLHRPAFYLEGVDERPGSRVGDCIAGLVDRQHVGADDYLKHLTTVVRRLGAEGRCVIVGRGANFILPAETTLRVRLVARPEDRARVVVNRVGLPAAEAARWVETTDRERASFVRGHFKEDVTAPLHYDLVLNTSRLTVSEAAGVIIETLRRLERRAAPAEQAAQAASPALA